MSEKLLDEINKMLDAKTIHELRQIARAVGVSRPAEGKKERITDCVLKIASGEADPVKPAVKGPRPKSSAYDREVVAAVMRCREISLSLKGSERGNTLSVGSGEMKNRLDFYAGGICELLGDKWILRTNGFGDSPANDVLISGYFANMFGLREGDFVSGRCKRNSVEELAILCSVDSLNGENAGEHLRKNNFGELTAVYPSEKLKTSLSDSDVYGNLLDIISPVGAGQRALVSGAHASGRTECLKRLAEGIVKNNDGIKAIIVSIDARPEEGEELKNLFSGCDVFVSEASAGAVSHVRAVRLSLEYAKRLAEAGKDVLYVLDDMTKYCLALSDSDLGYGENKIAENAKKVFCTARNLKEGGSLTVLTSAVSDGDGFVNAMHMRIGDLANMKISLSEKLARAHIFPPVDMENTFTYGEERLSDEKTLKLSAELRKAGTEQAVGLLKKYSVKELCDRFKG